MLKPTKNLSNNSSHCCKWMNVTVVSQDSATAHTAASTMVILHEFFSENVIFKGLWPPRSPDLTSPDFFFWSYFKDTLSEQCARPKAVEDE